MQDWLQQYGSNSYHQHREKGVAFQSVRDSQPGDRLGSYQYRGGNAEI